MSVVWIGCILWESWRIEAWLFILRLKSFIYIKIRHNLFAYNYMRCNLVFLLNSLVLHLVAYCFYVIPWKTLMSTVIISAVVRNFARLAGGGFEVRVQELFKSRRWDPVESSVLRPCLTAASFHFQLTGWMWVLLQFSRAVCLEWDVAVALREIKHV